MAFLFLISLCYIHTHTHTPFQSYGQKCWRSQAGCQLMYLIRRLGELCGTAGWFMLCWSHALSHGRTHLAHKWLREISHMERWETTWLFLGGVVQMCLLEIGKCTRHQIELSQKRIYVSIHPSFEPCWCCWSNGWPSRPTIGLLNSGHCC